MRIGQVSRSVYLMRFYLRYNIYDNPYILFPYGVFLYFTGLIKWQIEEMYIFILQANVTCSPVRFPSPYKPFQFPHILRVCLIFPLVVQVIYGFPEYGRGFFSGYILGNFGKLECFCVGNGNITRSLIYYMYFVPLVYQAAEGPSHRDHIVIGVRAEY